MKKTLTGEFLDFQPITEKSAYFRSIGLGEVTSLNIFKPSTTVFDENGLFSTEIFGPVDSELRFKKNGFIDFRVEVFHPIVYKNIVALGDKYRAIMAGEKNAVFNKETKDFDINEEGDTGFDFFVRHIDQIEFKRTNSRERDTRIEVIDSYGRSKDMLNSCIVIAAGLRDYTVDAKGKPSEDEVNTIYRRLIYFAQNLKSKNIDKDLMSLYDGPRYNIQLLMLELYEYFKTLLDGKKKFVQGSWSSRAVDYSTRNVVSGMKNVIVDIDVPREGRIDANTSVIGLFQFYKGIQNIGVSNFHTNLAYKAFEENSSYAYGFNKDTFKVEKFEVEEKLVSRFTTLEGFDSILNDFSNDDFKYRHVMVKNRYLLLKYEEGEKVEFFFPLLGIRDDVDKSKLQPVTYLEALYMCVCRILNDFGAISTRYPIANYGSTIPTRIYVRTTTTGVRKTLVIGYDEIEVFEYPDLQQEPFRTIGPHITHLKAFTMDFDGDTASNIISVTKEGNEEIRKVLNDKSYYLGPNGEAAYSVNAGVLDQTLKELSR